MSGCYHQITLCGHSMLTLLSSLLPPSIEDISGYAMLEPSFLHPGTLSALPDTWTAFVVAVTEADQQVGCGSTYSAQRRS
jgi:hypothetical protein